MGMNGTRERGNIVVYDVRVKGHMSTGSEGGKKE